MAKLTLSTVTTGFGTTNAQNTNNDAIETAMENTVSRDGTSPNAMNAAFDLNNNKLLNVATPTADADGTNKAYVDGLLSPPDTMGQSGGHWDAESLKIQSLAEPVASTDATTKSYVDGAISGSGNVPGPSDPADDNKALIASGGLFSWVALTVADHLTSLPAWAQAFLQDTTIAAARTELGAAGLADANVFTDTQTWKVGTDVASAADLDVTVAGNYFDVTGTDTITSIQSKGIGTTITLQFDGILTFTHSATDLILPGAADITTAAGDVAILTEYASADWRCISYTRADGEPIAASSGAWSTGDVKTTFKNAADTGWVLMDDGTIGNASSGGTTRANADTEELFELLWDNISDTYAPVLSGGSPVSRGATAQLDFDANRTITLPAALGRALGVSGSGSGLTTRALGETDGAEDATLVNNNIPTSSLSLPRGNNPSAGSTTGIDFSNDYGSGVPLTVGTGSPTAVDTLSPMQFLNVMIKL